MASIQIHVVVRRIPCVQNRESARARQPPRTLFNASFLVRSSDLEKLFGDDFEPSCLSFNALQQDDWQRASDLVPVCLPSAVGLKVTPLLPVPSPTIDFARDQLVISGATALRMLELNGALLDPQLAFDDRDQFNLPDFFFGQVREAFQKALQHDLDAPPEQGQGAIANFEASLASVFFLGKRVLLPSQVQAELSAFWSAWLTGAHEVATSGSGESTRVQSANLQFLVGTSRVWLDDLPDRDLTLAVSLSLDGRPDQVLGIPAPSIDALRTGFDKLQGTDVSVEPPLASIDPYLKLDAAPDPRPIADWVPRKESLAPALVPSGPRDAPREWEPFMKPGLPLFTRVDTSSGFLGNDCVRIAIQRSPSSALKVSAVSRVVPAFSVELDVRRVSYRDTAKPGTPEVWEAVPRHAYERLFDLLAFADPRRDRVHSVNLRIHAVVLRSDAETLYINPATMPGDFRILGLFGDGGSEAPAPEDADMRLLFASTWDKQITSAVVFLAFPDWCVEFSLEVSSDDPAESDVPGLLLPLPPALLLGARRALSKPWVVHPDTYFMQGEMAQALREKALVARVTSPALAALVPRDSVGSLDFHLGIRPPKGGETWGDYTVPERGLLGDFCKVVPWVEVFGHGDSRRASSRRALLLPTESLLPLGAAEVDGKTVWPYHVHARAGGLTKPAELRSLAQRTSEEFTPQFQRLFALGLTEPVTAASVLEKKLRATAEGYYAVECEIEDSHGQRITVRNLQPHPGQNVKRVAMIDASLIETASDDELGVLSFRLISGPRGPESTLVFDLKPSRLGQTDGELSPDQARLIGAVADIALAKSFEIMVSPLQLSTIGKRDGDEPPNDASRHFIVRPDVLGQAASKELESARDAIQKGCRRMVASWADGSAARDEAEIFACHDVVFDLEAAGVTAFAITYQVIRQASADFDLETTVARRRDQVDGRFGESVALSRHLQLAALTDLPTARHTYAALVSIESSSRSGRSDLAISMTEPSKLTPPLDVALRGIGIVSGTVELDPLKRTSVDMENVFFVRSQESSPPTAVVDLSVWGRRPCSLPWGVQRPEVVLDRLLEVFSRLASGSGVAVQEGGQSVFSPMARRDFLRSLARGLIVPLFLRNAWRSDQPTVAGPALVEAMAAWIDEIPLRGSRSRVHALFSAAEDNATQPWWEQVIGIKARLLDVEDSNALLVESRFSLARRERWYGSGVNYPAVLSDVPIPPGRAGVMDAAQCGVFAQRLRALAPDVVEPEIAIAFRGPHIGPDADRQGIEVPALSDQPIAPIACFSLLAAKCLQIDRLDQVEIELVLDATLSTVRSNAAAPSYLARRDAYGVATMAVSTGTALRLGDTPQSLNLLLDDALDADARIASLVQMGEDANNELLIQMGHAIDATQSPNDSGIKEHWVSAVVIRAVEPAPDIGVRHWAPVRESSASAKLPGNGAPDGSIQVTLKLRVPVWNRQALLAFHARDSQLTQPEINPVFAQTSTLVLSEARLFPALDHDLVGLDPVAVPIESGRFQVPLYELLDLTISRHLGGVPDKDPVMILFSLGRVTIEVSGVAPTGPVRSLKPLDASEIAGQAGGSEFPTYSQTFAEGVATNDGLIKSEMVTLEKGYVAYRISIFVHPKRPADLSPDPAGVEPGIGAVLKLSAALGFSSPQSDGRLSAVNVGSPYRQLRCPQHCGNELRPRLVRG